MATFFKEKGVNHLFVFNSILVNCRNIAETLANFIWGGSIIFFFNSILVNCGVVAESMANLFWGSQSSFVLKPRFRICGKGFEKGKEKTKYKTYGSVPGWN